ncbi:MAG: diguanylate cyclase [Nitrospirota bacterium]
MKITGLFKRIWASLIVHGSTERKRAEKQLRQAAEDLESVNSRLSGIIEGTNDLIAALDLEFRFIVFNSAYRRAFKNIFGKDIETGMSIVDALAHLPEEQSRIVELWDRALKGEQFTIAGEFGPQRRTYEAIFNTIKDKSGNRIGAALIARDITDHRRAEEELARISRRYELILEYAGEGIYGLDSNGNHTIVNRAAVHMLGYPVEEIVGRKSHPIWHHTRADGTPYPEEECKIYKTIRDGVARHVDDEVFWKKDGTSFPVEYTVTPIYRNDTIDGVVVVFRDVTERRRAEEQIKRLTRKYEMILNSAGEGIYGVALNDAVVFVNTAAASMLGYSVEEVIGKRSHSTWHHTRLDGSTYPEEECAIYKTFREGTVNRISNEVFWRKDGTSFPVEYTTTPVFEDSRIVGAVITFRDITERKHAEEAAHEAARNLSNYVGELEQRNREIALLAEMNSLLQACLNADEVSQIIDRTIKQIFPDESGIVYLFNSQQGVLESIAIWGDFKATEHVLSPRECWALRLGRTYLSGTGRAEMVCPHIVPQPDTAYLCVPMIALSETLGLLYLQFNGRLTSYREEAQERRIRGKQRLAEAVAESIALSLANFKLRETLYTQSIHDPLTGLFNRRYMDELLGKELHRMLRKGLPLSLIMLDIDHFKIFNDTFGHEAGDMLLRELGGFFRHQVRAEDFACRYGGEEFVLILPETPLEIARQRAEQLRRNIKDLTIHHRGQTLGPVTLSLGVAVFPLHGDNGEALLRAADAALYRAKAEGRDKVVVV